MDETFPVTNGLLIRMLEEASSLFVVPTNTANSVTIVSFCEMQVQVRAVSLLSRHL